MTESKQELEFEGTSLPPLPPLPGCDCGIWEVVLYLHEVGVEERGVAMKSS
eukprot:CAMPEP_0195533432 /NCGR_PEP_ID=MMETSP0794_2-20130614/40453_1 /TAXON_ID=515487 /ORGANISM="Stephanopyxis turris, Strain CCMP 815" /LENGTH=50 /DNA_ID=CAMNT_0040665947 /DNA_START=137 /DNA_END=285 /DNA_ORIENTATION=+